MDSEPVQQTSPLVLQTPSSVDQALSTNGEAEDSVEEGSNENMEELSKAASKSQLFRKGHPSPRKGHAHHRLLALGSALTLAGLLISIALRKK